MDLSSETVIWLLDNDVGTSWIWGPWPLVVQAEWDALTEADRRFIRSRLTDRWDSEAVE